jgi:hypothetical protein
MRRPVLGLLVAFACTEPAPDAPADRAAAERPPTADGDPLLARARASIENGRIDPDVRAEILASTAPEHARARALILAMERAPAGADEAGDDDGKAMPAVVAPLPAGEDAPIGVGSPVAVKPPPGAEAVPAVPPPSSQTPTLPPLPKGVSATLTKLALAPRSGGATLVMEASSGVLVGVASQPASGLVRLVVESASALPKVLSGRPRLAGVRVTDVVKGKNTVIVTLELEDGWSYGGVKRTSGGARVELRGPD